MSSSSLWGSCDEELCGGGLDDLLPVKEQFTVLPADYSQLSAIELARRGGHLVVFGPPGTGKSQTIANMIATLLADGKRVLFVSEKTAALDVVKRRLEECELGCFCLDLHSHRAHKASVYQQIRDALDTRRSGVDLFPMERLEEQRQRLNTVVRALHEKRSPLGLSVFEVHGQFAQVRSMKRVEFPLRRVEDLSANALTKVREATARIARRKAEFEAHQTSPWRALRLTNSSMELADELRRMAAMMREAVSELRTKGVECEALGLPLPGSSKDVESAGKIAGHMASCPGVPEIWLSHGVLHRLARRAEDFSAMQAERRRLEESLEPFFGSELPRLDFEQLKALLHISFDDQQRLKSALGEDWKERLCPLPESREKDWRNAIHSTRRLREDAARLVESLSPRSRLERLSRLRNVLNQTRVALGVVPVPESWFEPGSFDSLRSRLVEARGALSRLEADERRLFEEFDTNLLEVVSHEMLVRYRTDHQSPWRIFKSSYRADQRALRGCLRRTRKLNLQEALAIVESALRVRRLREEWEASSLAYASVFGSLYSGRTTDWEALSATITEVEAWVAAWEWGPESAKRCFSALDRAAIEPLVRSLEASLVEWEASSLACRADEPDPDLSVRLNVLESGAEIVARLERDGRSLWFHLRRAISDWTQLVDVLSGAAQLRRIQGQEEELAPALQKDFEGYYDGPESDWEKVKSAICWTRDLLDLVHGRVPAGLASQCWRPRPSEEYIEQEKRLLEALRVFRTTASDFSKTFDPRQVGWDTWETPAFELLTIWLSWIEEHADSATFWLEYMEAVRELEGLLAPGAVDALRQATDDALQVPDLVLRRLYSAWIDFINEKDVRLRFRPRDHEDLREEFRKLDKRFVHANRARVRAQCFRRYPEVNGPAIEYGQLGILNRQLSLRRRQMPVRRLIQQIPQLLQALKPCFLMSPVAVSQYLSRGELATDNLVFDAVIFDEASQVFPEDAVPAIARARQVIVVGDEKQLPPTSFFRREIPEDDEEEASNDDRLEGTESILDVMKGMEGSGVRSAYLGIHYRSRHENLIRYSNHHFYDDRLLIFPSPDTAADNLGLRDVYLPDGRYDAAASRTNQLEAERTIDCVFDLLRSLPPYESVGVVTLSRSQADRIEELLNQRRLQDSSLDSRFAEDRGERFFIKNLENVQGDERDHIILSIGYGPTVGSGSVPNRFGPINREGGKRRLNVAVTRARRSLTVIRSLRPEQITSESDGARLLRRFLEYVQDPVRAFEGKIDVDPAAETESLFEEAVYRSLTERGYRVSKQVGCFGYRIDLAIASEDGSRYDLGIECDGASYHRAPTARDRDWLRQTVLEGLGWTIHRIWSTDWIRDPEAQIRSVEQQLKAARARAERVVAQNATVGYEVDSAKVSSWSEPEEHDEGWILRRKEDFRFVPYRPIQLSGNHRRASIVEENPQKLRQLVTRIVDAEGPIHIDLVIERVRGYYGASRAGKQIQAAILQAAESEARDGRICWRTLPRGLQMKSFLDMSDRPDRPEPRGPEPDGSIRSIEHVWAGEIEAGLIRVVESSYGVFREDAIVATARAFGYERVGWKIQQSITEAVERLLRSGEIVETPAGLTKRELPLSPLDNQSDKQLNLEED